MTVLRIRIGLVSVLIILLAWLGYQRYADYQALIRRQEQQQALLPSIRARMAQAQRDRAEQRNKFTDWAAVQLMPQAYPKPPSAWLVGEKAFYRKLLEHTHADILVAPLQINVWGFDRGTRAAMSADLAVAVESARLGKVLDPFLAAKALGDGQREYTREELYALADAVGANRIIFGAAGHDYKGKMSITLLSQPRANRTTQSQLNWSAPVVSQTVDNIVLDDDHPAVDNFAKAYPGMLKSLGITVKLKDGTPAQLELAHLPDSPLELVKNRTNSAQSAYMLLLLGMLTPDHIEHVRECFAARALLITSTMSPESPEYKALRARAYMMMGYRVAALTALATPGTLEEQELQAVLNGNLPTVRSLGPKETNPLKRLIDALDENRIAADFGIITGSESSKSIGRLQLPGIWRYLATRAATDPDVWSSWSNAELKSLLDHEFPVSGFTVKDILQGSAAVGSVDKIQTSLDLSVFNHARHYLADHPPDAIAPLASLSPSELDYLQLLAAIGDDNLIRHLHKLASIQGLPQESLEEAVRLESVYKGNPYYTLERAQAEWKAAERASGAEQEGLIRASYEDAFNALYWEQAQSTVASDALNLVAGIGRPEYGYFDNFYNGDLPYHPLYMLWGSGGNPAAIRQNGLAALSNATSQFGVVDNLLGNDPTQVNNSQLAAEVGELIAERFAGSPRRATVLADLQLHQGHVDEAESLLRESIKIAPRYEDAYYTLGKIAFESGRSNDAVKIFLSYPPFQHTVGDEIVATSNYAYKMGNFFFDSGDFPLATRLFRISVAQQSNSASEMGANTRLNVLSGNIGGAMQAALERGQRYADGNAFRDYLAMLHATSQSQLAWSGFNTLVRQLDDFGIWESALVGHHREGGTEATVTTWVKRPEFAPLGDKFSFAAHYLVKFATTDRIPSDSLADVLDTIERPVWQMETGLEEVVRPNGDGRIQQVLGPIVTKSPRGVLPIGVFEQGKKHRVKSGLAYFVAAYGDIKHGKFEAARQLFDEAADLYDLQSTHSSYMLAYYALAVAKSGADTTKVDAVLGRFAYNEQGFDYQLARAVLAAVHGNTSEALKSLQLARHRRWLVEDRPILTTYTYGDICETLYRLTENDAYRREALDWAKVREKAEPWQAWSYAMEAALAPDSVERRRAIAMAWYLDPQSVHLSTLKKADIDAAVKEFGALNIFLPKRGERTDPAAI
jgi:tetratricopeptide (TPR) repeat protein